MREGTQELARWFRFCQLIITELYEILLKHANNESEKANLFHQLRQTKFLPEEYAQTITFYEKSIEILQTIFLWLFLTTTLVWWMTVWINTHKHYHIMNAPRTFDSVHYVFTDLNI